MDGVTLHNINKLKTKTVVFVITGYLEEGLQQIPPIRFPYSGLVSKVSATCYMVGTEDCTFTVQKCSESGMFYTPTWYDINTTTLTAASSATISNNINITEVEQNDYFRIVIGTPGDVGGLTIEVEIII